MGDVATMKQAEVVKAVPARSLVRKLAEVMGEVERIPKSGHNDFHGYDYATEADIVASVRQGMAKRALMLFPDVQKTEWREGPTGKDGKGKRICSITVRFTIEDGESGETRELHIIGEGEGADDKTTYKAMTGATKYALLKLFLIPTGDDPERDDTAGTHAAPKQDNAQAETRQKIWGGEKQAPAAGPAYTIKFGNNKGKTLPELSDGDLAWHLKKATEDVAKNDQKWHAKNLEALQAMKAETARRAGQPPKPQGETPYQRLDRTLRERHIDPSQWGPVLKQTMAPKTKTSEVTEEHVASVLIQFPEPPEGA
jgi:hypothetical protein